MSDEEGRTSAVFRLVGFFDMMTRRSDLSSDSVVEGWFGRYRVNVGYAD